MILLNLGAGDKPAPAELLNGSREIRVDLASHADVVADIRSLPFADEYADTEYASHVIEHFDEHEVIPMLVEWRRVLKTGGTLVVECPDIQSTAKRIAFQGVDAVLYGAVNGAQIRGQDVLYGWTGFIASGGDPMRHKCAFDTRKLAYVLNKAGFVDGEVTQFADAFSLRAVVRK